MLSLWGGGRKGKKNLYFKKQLQGNSRAVQWLSLGAFTAGSWVQSLPEQLRSCTVCSVAKKTKQAKHDKSTSKHNYKGESVLIFQNGNQCQGHVHFHKKARVPNTSTRPVSEVWFSLPNLSMVGKRIHSTCYPKIFEEQVLWVLSPYSKHLWESQGLRGF